MTTFGLPLDSFGSVDEGSRGGDVPDSPVVDNVPRQICRQNSGDVIIEAAIRQSKAAGNVEDFPLVATQPQTQPRRPTDPQSAVNKEQHLVGILIPSNGKCQHFELDKTKRIWRIGRHQGNDLVLPGIKLSNFHCEIRWNGKKGKESEVTLIDDSRNGTWVNSLCLNKGSKTILRGGTSISLGAEPDIPNEWRFVFRDVEGQSAAHMVQFWSKYDIGYELGVGAFARVHRCIERVTTQEYAVKIIDRNKLRRSEKGDSSIVREISILQRLSHFRHKNIVSLREYFEEDDAIYLILELVRGGDLLTYIGKHGALSEIEVRRMAGQICHAVAYIHSQGIAHRDLKPENVMLTGDPVPDCKVADFGLAKLVNSGTFLRTVCGTPAYLAPEVPLRRNFHSQAYDDKVDSWSLGVIFYCMLTGCAPFAEPFDQNATAEEQQRYFNDRAVNWLALDSVRLSEEGHTFLRYLLAEDPRHRQSVAHMLDHPWIQPFVPSAASDFQHPLPADTEFRLTPSPTASRETTPTADVCSQTMSHLNLGKDDERMNLSDVPIPGLSLLTRVESDDAASKHMPGAYLPGSAAAAAATTTTTIGQGCCGGKRKNTISGGSSPLSSLSELSDGEEDEEDLEPAPAPLPPPPPQPKSKPPSKPKNARTVKKASSMASSASSRRAAPRQRSSMDEDRPTRRSARQPKVARYA